MPKKEKSLPGRDKTGLRIGINVHVGLFERKVYIL